MENKKKRGKEAYSQVYYSEKWRLKRMELRDINKNIDTILDLFMMETNIYNALVISYETMEKMTGLSRTTLYRTIKLLEEYDFIKIYKTGSSNIYTLNEDYYWKQDTKMRFWASAYSNDKFVKYARIDARIVASDVEQTEKIQKQIDEEIDYIENKLGLTINEDGLLYNKNGELVGDIFNKELWTEEEKEKYLQRQEVIEKEEQRQLKEQEKQMKENLNLEPWEQLSFADYQQEKIGKNDEKQQKNDYLNKKHFYKKLKDVSDEIKGWSVKNDL